HKDDIFDLDKIPIEVLDNAWKRYHPYLFTIDHHHPLSNRLVVEGNTHKEKLQTIKNIITKTFPIPSENFLIVEGNHGLYAAVLIALLDDNIDVIETAMEEKGFFRSQPTNEQLLSDRKNRKWLDVRFEPTSPDDITEEIHRRYKYIYHLTPSIFSDNILKNGFLPSNNNSNYRYSEDRVYFMVGKINNQYVQELVNTLYNQAKNKDIDNLTNEYTLFTLDLSLIKNDIRFFYDINEPKGAYTKQPIPQSVISVVDKFVVNAITCNL
ncbi:MAG: hypothetical protein ACI30H_05765, partial [Paludibacteraceae bacterium]